MNAVIDIYNNLKNDNIALDNSLWLKENTWELHVKKIIDSVRKFKVSQPSTLSEIN